jgi:hypothetical protein
MSIYGVGPFSVMILRDRGSTHDLNEPLSVHCSWPEMNPDIHQMTFHSIVYDGLCQSCNPPGLELKILLYTLRKTSYIPRFR